jgi:hypothetical protein
MIDRNRKEESVKGKKWATSGESFGRESSGGNNGFVSFFYLVGESRRMRKRRREERGATRVRQENVIHPSPPFSKDRECLLHLIQLWTADDASAEPKQISSHPPPSSSPGT